MKPKTLHLLLLAMFFGVPLLAGGVIASDAARSSSEMAVGGWFLGLLLLAGSVSYGLITSLLYWKWGNSVKRVVAIHAAVIGSGILVVVSGFLLLGF